MKLLLLSIYGALRFLVFAINIHLSCFLNNPPIWDFAGEKNSLKYIPKLMKRWIYSYGTTRRL